MGVKFLGPETAQQLRAHTALAEDQSLMCDTLRQLTTACGSASQISAPLHLSVKGYDVITPRESTALYSGALSLNYIPL